MLTESYTYLERAVSTECVFFTFKFFKNLEMDMIWDYSHRSEVQI